MRLETARAYRRIAEIQRKLGKAPQAEKAYKRAAESFQELADQFPEAPEYRHELADTLYKLGDHLGETGSIPEAGSAYNRALDLQEKLVAEFPAVPEYRRDLAMGLYSLGKRLRDLRAERSEVEKPFRRSMALMEGLRQESPKATEYRAYLACGLQVLGYYLAVHCHDDQGRRYQNEAIAILEEVTKESPGNPTYRSMLGAAYCWSSQGQPPQEAERSLRKALEVQRKLAADFPSVSNIRYDVVRSLVMLAGGVLEANHPDQAEEAYAEAVTIGESLAKETPTIHFYRHRLGGTYIRLANLLSRTGKLPEAEKRYRQCITVFEELAHDFPQISVAQNLDDAYSSFGLFLRSRGRHEEALKMFQERINDLSRAIERNAQTEPRQRQLLADTYRSLGVLLQDGGKPVEAEKAYRQGVTIREKLTSEFPQEKDRRVVLGHSLWQLAGLLRTVGQSDEAEKLYRRALVVFEKLAADFPSVGFYRQEVGFTWWLLGWLLNTPGRLHDAEDAFCKAVEVHVKLAADFPKEPEYRSRLSRSYSELTHVLSAAGKHAELAQNYLKRLELAPKDVGVLKNLAWLLATCPDLKVRDSKRAVEFAKQVVDLAPTEGNNWNTLGTAHYRAGDWKSAIETLLKADELYGGRIFSANAFFLAMAHWQRGEKEQALKWYAPALIWMEKYSPQAEELRRFRAEAAILLGLPEKLTPEQELAKNDYLKYYTFVLEAHPKAAWAYQQRGMVHARLGHWDMAEADLAKTVALNAGGPVAWNYLALLRLHRGNRDGYCKACRDMLQRFGLAANADASYWMVWTCALAPDAVTDRQTVVQMAEKAVAANPKHCDLLQHLGAVLYRAGRFEAAAKRLTEAEAAFPETQNPRSSIVYNWLFQGMTQHRLGHAAEARRYLDKAVKEIDQPSTKAAVAWNRRLTLQLLRQEAQELLRKPSGAKNPESEKKPG
jgi:tetratricopeptide (TPR) repeat protein